MTWTCPKCGKIFVDEASYKKHFCNSWDANFKKKCIYCNGEGVVSGFLEPAHTCPHCGGSGRA